MEDALRLSSIVSRTNNRHLVGRTRWTLWRHAMAKPKPEAYIRDKALSPESLMMGYGYRPELSEGAIKCPIFQTSTFVFHSAEEGKAFFELAYGLRKRRPQEQMDLIYSRLNNPDLEILEDRLTLWDEAEACA